MRAVQFCIGEESNEDNHPSSSSPFFYRCRRAIDNGVCSRTEAKEAERERQEEEKKHRQVVSGKNKLFLGVGFLYVLLHSLQIFFSSRFSKANAFYPSRRSRYRHRDLSFHLRCFCVYT